MAGIIFRYKPMDRCYGEDGRGRCKDQDKYHYCDDEHGTLNATGQATPKEQPMHGERIVVLVRCFVF